MRTLPALATPAANAHSLAPASDSTEGDKTAAIVHAVQTWHNTDSGHPGAWRICAEQPCDVVNRIANGW